MRSHVAIRAPAPPIVHDVLRSPGTPLEPHVQGRMEARFGHDFSSVRVHSDIRAAESAQAVGANAYTLGNDIVFGAGRYQPGTSGGSRLLAHELAHTVQQRDATTDATPVASGSQLEGAAESAGRAAANGSPVTQTLGTSGIALARDESSDLDFKLMETMEAILRSASSRPVPLAPEQADKLIAVLSWYRNTHSMESFFTIIGHSDEVYDLLAPWGFSGGLVSSHAPGMQRPHELLDSFDRAIALWTSDDPTMREKRRRKKARVGGSYLRFPTVAESEYKASQLVAAELPRGGFYQGPQGGLGAARQREENEHALSQIDAIRHGGAIATLGRVVGATTAWATGRDVKWGGEAGAAFGGLGDAFLAVQAGRASRTPSPSTRSGGEPTALRPRPAIVEKAPPREPLPEPDPPGVKAVPRTEAVPEPITDAPTNPIPRGGEVGERVGGFRILGEKGLKGTTFEREVWGINAIDKVTTERGVRPVLELFRDLTAEARAAGATELRITGRVVVNKNILRMKPLVEKYGGTFTRVDELTVDIRIPVSAESEAK